MATVNMNFRVDEDLKKEADKLFKEMGMNTSVALNMFLTQSVREQRIPFTPTANKKISNDLLEAAEELRLVESGQKKLKGYHNIDEMFEDIINDQNKD